jgi:hypothetical protein
VFGELGRFGPLALEIELVSFAKAVPEQVSKTLSGRRLKEPRESLPKPLTASRYSDNTLSVLVYYWCIRE